MTTTSDGFGQRLRGLREAAGLSREQLSQAAGVSVRALTYMECGRTRGPQRRTVQALARALGLTADAARSLEASAAPGRQRPRATTRPATGPAAGPAAGPTTGPTTGPAAGPSAGPAAPATDSVPDPAAASGLLSLPRDIGDFTARGTALAALREWAATARTTSPPVVVVAGTPGLGKTALAVHAAHRLAPGFPDGRFWLDLRAMDAEPVRTDEALARLLRALGVPERSLPRGQEDRAALWRTLVAERRLLLVLDNAAGADQVRPLLPASGSSLTLVTSRDALSGLESVHRVALPLLRREEAVTLLTRIIGPERVAREPAAARALADLCGRLPLALRIAGQRLAARPEETLAKLVALLDREELRLDGLQTGDLRVRAAFALSYRRLDPLSRLVLRRGALAAGPDVSPGTAALLAGAALRDVRLRLEELCDQGLLQSDPTAERYRFHDLLRLFAVERVAAEDPPEARNAALDRAARWTLARATTAALHFDAVPRGGLTAGDPDPGTAPRDRDEARAWLTAERAQWLAALRHARTAGRHRQVLDAAEAMHWFSDLTKHWPDWVDVFRHAVDAARALGERREEATHLNYLAWAHSTCGHDHRAALETADVALLAARVCDDPLQTGWALYYGAVALRALGRAEEAIARFRSAVDHHRDGSSPESVLASLSALNSLGVILREHGRPDQALEIHRRSHALCGAGIPGRSPELVALYRAVTLQHLGDDYAALARWQEAEPALREALDTFEELDLPAWSGPIHLGLGRVLHRLDRPEQAREALTSALRVLTAHHHPLRAEAAAALDALDRVSR
ncbi:ATP-binding protein [Streptomyces sp. JNUCC 64]